MGRSTNLSDPSVSLQEVDTVIGSGTCPTFLGDISDPHTRSSSLCKEEEIDTQTKRRLCLNLDPFRK